MAFRVYKNIRFARFNTEIRPGIRFDLFYPLIEDPTMFYVQQLEGIGWIERGLFRVAYQLGRLSVG